MTTEQYAIGYEEGHQVGFNEGVDAGFKAATTRQEAKIKALRESLNWALSMIWWSFEEDVDTTQCTKALDLAKEQP